MNSFAGSIDNGARDEIAIGRAAIGRHLKDGIAGQSGLPIKSAKEAIGAVGVSGVPNGADQEEACAQAAIDRVVHQLK